MGIRSTEEDFLTARLTAMQVASIEHDLAELDARDPYALEAGELRTFRTPDDPVVAPLVRLLHLILSSAVMKNATHVLLLPGEQTFEVAFFIVDAWQLEVQPPHNLVNALGELVKDLCGAAGAVKVRLRKGQTVHALASVRRTSHGTRTLIRLVDLYH